MPGQLDGELLLLDFMNFSSAEAQGAAPRRVHALRAARSFAISSARMPDIEIALASLAAARASTGFELIDVRTAEEFAAAPTAARHIPMPALLADPEAA